ncbi:4-(cytidine 5'-diphospho)-2-C-methyl-D-erythritol kinase [Hujiaoplasma nucleasis]|uniref:4-diphosphocytidyl-2-C-methyl-D-erythritol kinase n=1 Tax=Hujiaoplasma nucleasis TaxID=2725268 RepID=A0A7L6N7B0_9MOLU|nr:4-(cytidine 5'-diphospho)-2-C-methyl-D-erythritol kinase [Hujiaoplasma nucleasis]QLY40439.1 4-(cytidine 5'-diphospho)-2-C-methyl-D-erythritol kinase [Hujiaoplasma nucleasis]
MIRKKAYAKINLFLNVMDKRKDGYHDLEMVNAKIDLYDEITIKKCQLTTGIIIKSNDMFLSSQDNVILQCARYMQDKYHIQHGIQIVIDKLIPYGAGLGGNSTDAASVIHGINELCELELSLKEMQEIGEIFGADIPYCLIDEVALVTKTGEVVEAIPNQLKNKQILLIYPKIHVLTASVFNEFDKNQLVKKDVNILLNAIEKNDIKTIQKNLFNALEETTISLDIDLREFKDNLLTHLGDEALVMTGSGSSFFKLIEEPNQDIIDFIDLHKDKYLINLYKIV